VNDEKNLTYTGKMFSPFDPQSDDVDIKDIAHSLSMTCRFRGHIKQFYSVAMHSCMVSDKVSKGYSIINPYLSIWGLLHDAAEAYLADIPSPIKDRFAIKLHSLNNYNIYHISFKEAEERILKAIAIRYNLLWPIPIRFKKRIKKIDALVTLAEAYNLGFIWPGMPEISNAVRCWETDLSRSNPKDDESLFLDKFNYLINEIEHNR